MKIVSKHINVSLVLLTRLGVDKGKPKVSYGLSFNFEGATAPSKESLIFSGTPCRQFNNPKIVVTAADMEPMFPCCFR